MISNSFIKKAIIVVTVLITLLIIQVAYAYLNSTLTVTYGTVKQNALTWNVGLVAGSVPGTSSGNTSKIECDSATATTDTLSGINVKLTRPADKCTYEATISNSGSIDASISSIVPRTPTGVSCTGTGASIVCGNVTYKLVDSSSGSVLATSTVVEKNTTKNIKLIAEYTGNTAENDDFQQSNFGFTITFIQK